MNTFKDKKGFTLVELLAVIVVLAIISVIAVRAILPTFSNARGDGFAIEANEAITAASDAISLTYINSISSHFTKYDNNDYCFTLEDLVALGLYTKDLTGYAGFVYAKKGDYGYTYKVTMHNENYMITDQASAKYDTDATKSTVSKYSGGTYTCPATARS